MILDIQVNSTVEIDYTNYKGIRRIRTIIPFKIKFCTSEWHPEKQWILFATDIETKTLKQFAIKDIHSWKPTE